MHRRTVLKGAGATALASLLPGGASAANSLPMQAPVHVDGVGLRVRDADSLSSWYQRAVGLRELGRDGNRILLGAGDTPLLTLTEDSGLRLAGQREAGLFHTAFLLPSRRDMAEWIAMAIAEQIPVSGTADHRVSEAIYLTDPEGNGIEIYADRPQDSWTWINGEVQMGTYQLDVDDIMSTMGLLPPNWQGAPADTRIGHVHMKVGNATRAAGWWRETLDFDAVSTRPDAVFLSTGGYHHHVAVNEWFSAGAGRRSDRETGLDFVALRRSVPGAEVGFEDDWGTRILLI